MKVEANGSTQLTCEIHHTLHRVELAKVLVVSPQEGQAMSDAQEGVGYNKSCSKFQLMFLYSLFKQTYAL